MVDHVDKVEVDKVDITPNGVDISHGQVPNVVDIVDVDIVRPLSTCGAGSSTDTDIVRPLSTFPAGSSTDTDIVRPLSICPACRSIDTEKKEAAQIVKKPTKKNLTPIPLETHLETQTFSSLTFSSSEGEEPEHEDELLNECDEGSDEGCSSLLAETISRPKNPVKEKIKAKHVREIEDALVEKALKKMPPEKEEKWRAKIEKSTEDWEILRERVLSVDEEKRRQSKPKEDDSKRKNSSVLQSPVASSPVASTLITSDRLAREGGLSSFFLPSSRASTKSS